MIRDRRPEDLGRLVAVLDGLDPRHEATGGVEPGDWLREVDAERSWVFDQAPVTVAPTSNVVGHVQVHGPARPPWLVEVADRASCEPGQLHVVGRLFVKPVRHAHGIARYLLTAAVEHVERQGRVVVLEPSGAGLVPTLVRDRLGFAQVRAGDGYAFVRAPVRAR